MRISATFARRTQMPSAWRYQRRKNNRGHGISGMAVALAKISGIEGSA
jgi:hypothetical protein